MAVVELSCVYNGCYSGHYYWAYSCYCKPEYPNCRQYTASCGSDPYRCPDPSCQVCDEYTYNANPNDCRYACDDTYQKTYTGSAVAPDIVVVGKTYLIQLVSLKVSAVKDCTVSGSNMTVTGINPKIRLTLSNNCTATKDYSWNAKEEQILSYIGNDSPVVGDLVELSATSDKGLTNFTYSVDSEFVTIVGNQMLITKFGIYQLSIYEPGNDTVGDAELIVTLICSIDNITPMLIEV